MFFKPDGEYISMDAETSDDIAQYNVRMLALLRGNTDELPIVQQVITDQYGGFKLMLSHGLVLEVFSDSTRDVELWRVFRPGIDEKHFVMLACGIEGDDDE